jgi:hypothetical protein
MADGNQQEARIDRIVAGGRRGPDPLELRRASPESVRTTIDVPFVFAGQ